MGNQPPKPNELNVFRAHPRDWRNNLYVYPVISRRSGGLSIGVNLNPDMACNFDCIYCQVDRSRPVTVRQVDLDRLRNELDQMLKWAVEGTIFSETGLDHVRAALHRVNDIAFSGDGEPTTCPVFAEAVQTAADLKAAYGLADVKIILITDACYLTRPKVMPGLEIMDAANGEIWAKLDAGTQAYFERVNRPNHPLRHVMDNIIAAARTRPICIQSLFMRIDGAPPSDEEIVAFTDRLNEVKEAGGTIKLVQVYTAARKPAESCVTPLTDEEVDTIADVVRRRTGLPAASYYAG